jgi:hypothetical protein
VGAIGGALTPSQPARRGSGRRLALVSVKSCYGHTEGAAGGWKTAASRRECSDSPTAHLSFVVGLFLCAQAKGGDSLPHRLSPPAGLTGLLFALAAQQRRQLAPTVALRELNPYVAAALGDWHGRQGLAAALPRQQGPQPDGAAPAGGQAAAGTSSFGMSGVNAHALLAAAGGEAAAASLDPAGRLAWQLAAHWPVPLAHPLLSAAAAAAGATGAARFGCNLGAARLAFLQDHRVAGRPLLPATCGFELLLAAAAAALEPAAQQAQQSQNEQGGLGLSGVAIQSPKLLPMAAAARDAADAALVVELRVGSGAATVASPGGGAPHVSGRACMLARPQPCSQAGSSMPQLLRLPARAALAVTGGAPAAPARCNLARIASPGATAPGDGWHAHPAAADAALHLSAVAAAGEEGSGGSSRVPVGVGAVLAAAPGSSSGNSTTSSGAGSPLVSPQQWSASELPLPAADGSAVCSVRARLAGGGRFTAAGLQARALGGSRAGASAGAAAAAAEAAEEEGEEFEQRNFTYAVEWQTAGSAFLLQQQAPLRCLAQGGGLQLLAGSAAVPAAASLTGSGGGLHGVLVAARSLCIAPAARASGSGGAGSALEVTARGIELLQRILAASGSSASGGSQPPSVHALTHTSCSAAAAPACGRAAGLAAAGAPLAALLKVAAAEHPDRRWGLVSSDPAAAAAVGGRSDMAAAAAGAGCDQHGLRLAAGAVQLPRLLRYPM